MELKLEGFDSSLQSILTSLTKSAEKVKHATKDGVKAVCKKIQDEAVKRSPIDEGDLQESITTDMDEGATADKVVGYVHVPANSPASDYAMVMHEGEYNLGPASAQKQAASDVTVGRKFLERAATENEEALKALIKVKILKALR